MLKCLFTVCLVFIIGSIYAQVVIDQSDMPNENDTLFYKSTFSVPGNFEETGEDYYWDFSELSSNNINSEIFLSVHDAPFSYNLIFIPGLIANLMTDAQAPEIPGIVPLSIEDAYDFYRKSGSTYVKAGFAAKVNDVPSPIRYDNPEIIYEFPLSYGSEPYSSVSFFGMSVPDFGYYGQEITRETEVDGWGTLITPYGTFNCIRIASKLKIRDTTYNQTIGHGAFVSRPSTIEYKWLAKDIGIPVLQVNKTGPVARANYLYKELEDSLPVLSDKKRYYTELKLYPNPATDYLNVYKNINSSVSVIIYCQLGKSVKNIFMTKYDSKKTVDLSNLSEGLYYTAIISDTNKTIYSGKLIINR